jgi:hypothetical protein
VGDPSTSHFPCRYMDERPLPLSPRIAELCVTYCKYGLFILLNLSSSTMMVHNYLMNSAMLNWPCIWLPVDIILLILRFDSSQIFPAMPPLPCTMLTSNFLTEAFTLLLQLDRGTVGVATAGDLKGVGQLVERLQLVFSQLDQLGVLVHSCHSCRTRKRDDGRRSGAVAHRAHPRDGDLSS